MVLEIYLVTCFRIWKEKENVKILIVCPGKIRTNISVNAITGDGKKHSIMDESTDKGLSPDACAQQILNGIKNSFPCLQF